MKMNVSETTLALLASAEGAASMAARLGVSAVMALVEENITVVFKHGDAVELAGLLKDGGISKHSAKRYADLTVMAVKAIAQQATLASSKAKPAEKAGVRDASQQANLARLSGMSDMRDIRAWSKENSPKATTGKATTGKATTEKATTEAPIAPNIEAIGQMREIKEALALVNSGQVTPGEALATIADIVGIQLVKPVPTPVGKASGKGKAKPQAA